MALLTPQFTQDQQYTADQMRLAQSAVSGAGILNPGDLVVTPGTGLQVNIAAGQANVRQTVQTEGTYHNGLYLATNDASATPFNTISAPVSFPRLDMVILRVYDVAEQTLGGSSFARFEWVTGTETSGATLANRSGAAALPANSFLLADVLQTVGEVSIAAGNVGDRRQIAGQGFYGQGAQTSPLVDMVWPIPMPPIFFVSSTVGQGQFSSAAPTFTCAAPVFIPRRITANFLRWSYIQTNGTAVTSNYCYGIYDSSTRLMAHTASTAFTGATNSHQIRSEPLIADTTLAFEPGLYYAYWSMQTLNGVGANNIVLSGSLQTSIVGTTLPGPNATFANVSGFTSPPPSQLKTVGDMYPTFGVNLTVMVPYFVLSNA